ncbi:aminoglycoside phosphotransferase domain protein [Mycobacterium xenopi 4042]|uniref:Aminoglycoside phosphotransferase domain protein n=1 Tax=Mycobacterium xenopi 4042 TaxID=1299334 RepID=X7YIF6_MYCXE|nr:aminoglycoside phosphotransferase domain protein [Mycobacterium xenopi 4042]
MERAAGVATDVVARLDFSTGSACAASAVDRSSLPGLARTAALVRLVL